MGPSSGCTAWFAESCNNCPSPCANRARATSSGGASPRRLRLWTWWADDGGRSSQPGEPVSSALGWVCGGSAAKRRGRILADLPNLEETPLPLVASLWGMLGNIKHWSQPLTRYPDVRDLRHALPECQNIRPTAEFAGQAPFRRFSSQHQAENWDDAYDYPLSV